MISSNSRRLAFLFLSAAVLTGASQAFAQDAPAEAGDDWRPLTYSDLSSVKPTPATAAYAELWEREILANDQAYVSQGDTTYQNRNAPALEAHFVVRSPIKVAVLSILNTSTGCTVKQTDAATGNILKMCPMLTAIYRGGNVTVTRGRKACFLETALPNQPADPHNTVAYAAYDIPTKSIKLGVVINHQPIADCAQVIPLYPFEVPAASSAN